MEEAERMSRILKGNDVSQISCSCSIHELMTAVATYAGPEQDWTHRHTSYRALTPLSGEPYTAKGCRGENHGPPWYNYRHITTGTLTQAQTLHSGSPN